MKTTKKGDKPKLTADMVGYMRDDFLAGAEILDLADNYGVSRRTVERIVYNQTWISDEYGAVIARAGDVPDGIVDTSGDDEPEETVEEEVVEQEIPTVSSCTESETMREEPSQGIPTVSPCTAENTVPVRHPGMIELNLTPKTMQLVRLAMSRTGNTGEKVEDFLAKAVWHTCTEYARMPMRCRHSAIQRKTIRG